MPPRALAGVVVLVFAAVGTVVALAFPMLVVWDTSAFDPLLTFCWASMLGLATIGVVPRRDATLALVALVGGALIESWGTRSGLWTYFDGGTPPLFILPAWPAAAIASERVARPLVRLAARFSARAARPVYAVTVVAYVAWLVWFSRGALGHPLTWVAFACIATTALTGSDRRRDLALFAAGTLAGYPLERWGTTRECWTYFTGETPPIITVLSHGFATLAFARGASFVHASLARRFGDPVEDPSHAHPLGRAALGQDPHRELLRSDPPVHRAPGAR